MWQRWNADEHREVSDVPAAHPASTPTQNYCDVVHIGMTVIGANATRAAATVIKSILEYI